MPSKEKKRRRAQHDVAISLTESQYQKLLAHAKAQGFDSVEALTMDLYRDIIAMESDDPYLAITKRATQLKDKLDARLGKTSAEDTMLIPRDVVKKSKVEL